MLFVVVKKKPKPLLRLAARRENVQRLNHDSHAISWALSQTDTFKDESVLWWPRDESYSQSDSCRCVLPKPYTDKTNETTLCIVSNICLVREWNERNDQSVYVQLNICTYMYIPSPTHNHNLRYKMEFFWLFYFLLIICSNNI